MTTTPATNPRSALLLGATGLVGRSCLELLLQDDRYATVHALTRTPLSQQHPKLRSHVVPFAELARAVAELAARDVFCCLGTTIKKAGSEAAFRQVDYEYPLIAARSAAQSGARQFLIVTALGADPGSRIFYNRVKGEVERAICELPLATVHVLRPSMLLGERSEVRGEVVLVVAGASPQPLAPDETPEATFARLLASGLSRRDAVKQAARLHGLPSRDLYRRVLPEE